LAGTEKGLAMSEVCCKRCGAADVAVLNWVRDEARKLPEPSTKAEVVVVTLDEMWHFVKKD
jgi:hypothetical protein